MPYPKSIARALLIAATRFTAAVLATVMALAAPLAQIAAALEHPHPASLPSASSQASPSAAPQAWLPRPIAPSAIALVGGERAELRGEPSDLFDGTPRGLQTSDRAPVKIEIRLTHAQTVDQLTAAGAGRLRILSAAVDGAEAASSAPDELPLDDGFARLELARARFADRLVVEWLPDGNGTLSEVALWGRAPAARSSAPGQREATQLQLGLLTDAVAIAGERVSPLGYRFELPESLTPFASAYLRYRLRGRTHWTQLSHTLNGRASAPNSPARQDANLLDSLQVEPLAITALRPWHNQLSFDAGATPDFRIEDVALILVPHARTRAAAPPDGSARTRLELGGGAQPHQLVLHVTRAGTGSLALFADSQTRPGKVVDLGELPIGWHRVDVGGLGTARELWLAREPRGVSAGEERAVLDALHVTTSAAKERAAALALSYPLHGECTAAGAEIRGHGRVGMLSSVRVNGGAPIDAAPDGSFRVAVKTRGRAPVQLEGVFAGGATATLAVKLDPCDGAPPRGLEPDWDAPYSALIKADQGGVLEYAGARLEVPAGALARDTRISLRTLRTQHLAAMEQDKVNVTPGLGGFRFGPHGLRFRKPVLLSLPYDRAAMPESAREEEVFAFYFDEAATRWTRISRAGDARDGLLASVTDHFTDFVTATLALPDVPGPTSFAPGEMNEVGLADPAAGIPLMDVPRASPFGGAQLNHPIELPPGRNGLQPELDIGYSSEGRNGWLGLGWNLAPSSIEVDTKFGVPCYGKTPCADDFGGPEDKTYVLDGEEIIAAPPGYFATRPNLQSTTPGAVNFVRRSEGPFDRIERIGTTRPYHWIVTDKRGTRFIYGETGAARLGDPNENVNPSLRQSVFRWNLERVVDVFGNEVRYEYQRDEGCLNQLGAFPAAPLCNENFTSLYPSAITYTHHPSTGAPYRVSFERGNQVRPDQVLDARAGFVEAIRQRLAGVRVEYRPTAVSPYQTIRRYALQYEQGDFSKSLLRSISLQGPTDIPADPAARLNELLAPPHFVQHRMSYHRTKDPSAPRYDVFGEPVPAPSTPYQPQVWGSIGSGASLARNTSTSEGFNAHAGIGIGPLNITAGGGGSQGRDTVTTRIAELHGDGLSDFIDNGGGVARNLLALPAIAPTDFFSSIDLDADRTGSYVGSAATGVSSRSLGFTERSGWSVNGGLNIVGIGAGVAHSRSTATDKSAMADMNGDGFVDLVRVSSSVRVRLNDGTGNFGAELPWGQLSAADLDYTQDGYLGGSTSGVSLVDPLVRWVAPFGGFINIGGAIRKLAGGGDGFTARIWQHTGAAGVVWSHEFGPNDLSACVPSGTQDCNLAPLPPLFISAGTSILFQLSGRQNPALPQTFEDMVADDVEWLPTITYTGAGSELEPYGRPSKVFDFAQDFRVGGQATLAWTAETDGSVDILGTLNKLPTNDDLVLRIERRNSNDILIATIPEPIAASASGVITPPTISSTTIGVSQGDRLVFRVASTAPVDPARAVWRPRVRYRTYGRIDQAGNMIVGTVSCNAVGCTTHNDPIPHVPISLEEIERPVPAQVSTFHFAPYPVTQSFGGPRAVSATVTFPSTMSASERARTAVLVQGVHQLFDKAQPTSSDVVSVSTSVPSGGPYFLTIVSPVAPVSVSANVPDNVRILASTSGLSASPLSPGFHQWQYGEFNGEKNLPSELLLSLGGPFTGTNSYEPGIPGEVEDPVANPPVTTPAYLLRGGGMISLGQWRPSKATQLLAGVNGGQIEAIRIGDTWNTDFGANLAIASAGFNFGSSTTELDLFDVNGDRLPDSVTYGGVRYSRPNDLGFATTRSSVPMGITGSNVLREVNHFTGRLGLDIPNLGGDSGSELKNETNTRGQTTQFITTQFHAGADYGMSATAVDFIDMNGDGLVDQVKRYGDEHFVVRLGLGYRFSEPVLWTVGRWPSGFNTNPGPTVAGLISGLLNKAKLGALDDRIPNVVRVEDTGAHNAGAGGGFVVKGGGGVSYTMSRTIVDLVDVNGDGLPDAVMKIPGDNNNPLRVRLNLGTGFDTEQTWSVPSWGVNISDWGSSLPSAIVNAVGSADTLSFRRNQSTNVNIGFSICVIFCVGADGYHSTGYGAETLAFEDIDGDGLLDHVLKREGDSDVRAKLNQLGKANLLLRVERPLGSTMDLDYRRTGNRVDPGAGVDMPSSQFVLAATRIDDGRGNQYVETHDYQDGFYDRDERLRYGFAHVVSTRQSDGSQVALDFHNQDYYRKGRVQLSAERESAGGFTFSQQQYVFAPPPALPARTGVHFSPETSRTLTTFEKADPTVTWRTLPGGSVTTVEERNFDALGDLTIYTLRSEIGDPSDDLFYAIGYQRSSAPYFSRASSVTATSPSSANPLRQGTVAYDSRGALVGSATVIYGGENAAGTPYSGTSAITSYTVDGLGNLVSIVDPSGYALTVGYDSEYRLFRTTSSDSFGYESQTIPDLRFAKPAAIVDVNGHVIVNEYDQYGRLVMVADPRALADFTNTVRFIYSEQGSALPQPRPAWGKTLQRDELLTSAGVERDPVTTVSFVDGLGRQLQTKRDALRDLGDGSPPVAGMTVSGQVHYDARGRIDETGQPTFVTVATPSHLAGSQAETFTSAPPLRPTLIDYDTLGRIVRVEVPDGSVTSSGYSIGLLDGATRLVNRGRDALGRERLVYSDVNGSARGVVERNTVGGALTALTTRYAYDAANQLTAVTDAAGKVTTAGYDSRGLRVRLNSPDMGLTEWSYDLTGNVVVKETAKLRAASQSIRYQYAFNRLATILYDDTDPVVLEYGAFDEDGVANGNLAGRLKLETSEAGERTFTYDELGNPAHVEMSFQRIKDDWLPNYDQALDYTFDSFGRLLSIKFPGLGKELVSYDYDAGGKVTSILGKDTEPTSIFDPQLDETAYLTQMGYDEFGARTKIVYGNGLTTLLDYDDETRRLTSVSSDYRMFSWFGGAPPKPFQRLQYEYDPVGNITSVRNDVPLDPQFMAKVTVGNTDHDYQYDQLNQLTHAEGVYQESSSWRKQYSLDFTYDGTGNITRKNQVSEKWKKSLFGNTWSKELTYKDETYNTQYFYEGPRPHAPTRLEKASPAFPVPKRRAIEYDGSGNQRRWIETETLFGLETGRRDVEWTAEDRVRKVKEGLVTKSKALFDGDSNRRVHYQFAFDEIAYLDQHLTIRNGAHLTKHIYAGDIRIASKGGVLSHAHPLYYHPDHLGSVQYVSDESQDLVEHAEYFPSGELWVDGKCHTLDGPPSYLFNGKEYELATGLYAYGARHYDPRQSQWLSPEPALSAFMETDYSRGVWDPINLASYGYARNNPVRYGDPSGAIPVDTVWDIASIAYDIGKIGVGYATSNPGLIAEGGVDLAADGAALLIPYVPAGATKIARLTAKHADEVIDAAKNLDKANDARKAASKAEGAGSAAGKGPSGGSGSPSVGSTANAAESAAATSKGAKRGPKTDPTAPHNATIRSEADALEAAGNTIVAGGGRKPERLIPTPGGKKGGRRPDILYRTPEAQLKGRNVGRTRPDGTPVKRELDAMEDLEKGGVPTDFKAYDR